VIFTRAPLRLSIGGGGTDLPSYYEQHGGFIVSAAINKYVYIYVNRPAADDLLRLKYSKYEEVLSADELKHDLVRPALKLLGIERNVEIASMADVPAGTGLGSSGAYLVALVLALHELKRERVAADRLAEMSCHIEIDLAGHPVGKHDHYLAVFGGLTCLDIQRDGRVLVTALRMDDEVAEELRSRVLLFFTGLTRSADDILHQQRKATRDGETHVIESLHRTKDIGLQIKDALERGELDQFGKLLHEHWEIKKRRSDLISTSNVDYWYQQARSAGAIGGKLVGAGGGGFLMLYVPRAARARVRECMRSLGLREMGYQFDFEGAKVLVNF
jgi:D-glycero-alpha-D-manno-heptose-7-phosphate kinase